MIAADAGHLPLLQQRDHLLGLVPVANDVAGAQDAVAAEAIDAVDPTRSG